MEPAGLILIRAGSDQVGQISLNFEWDVTGLIGPARISLYRFDIKTMLLALHLARGRVGTSHTFSKTSRDAPGSGRVILLVKHHVMRLVGSQ